MSDEWEEEERKYREQPTSFSERNAEKNERSNWGNSRNSNNRYKIPKKNYGDGESSETRNWRDNSTTSNDREGARTSSKSISVQSTDVGKIIGKGGKTIRELQDNSGARIQVNRDSDGYGQTTVVISGNEDAQRKAEDLINDIISGSSFNNRYDQGGFNKRSYSDESYTSTRNNFEGFPGASATPAAPAIDWKSIYKKCDEFQKNRWTAAPKLEKNFYFEHPDVASMNPATVDEFRKENFSITAAWFDSSKETRPVPNPVQTFHHAFEHYPDILELVENQGFKSPSPIQCQAWPVLLQGLDLIGIAQTGTGKTLAFLLPALIHIDLQPVPRESRGGPNVLVLAPTRELAQQIEREAVKFKYRDIKSVCVYGGGSRREQVNVVTKGVQIVIATPGRLNDLVASEIIDVSSITYLVLDEADRMLDMGFEPQIRKILLDIRPDRQTVMTSATWPENVRRLATSYMSNPVQVCVGSLDLATANTVYQVIEFIPSEEKRDRLYQFISEMAEDDKVIVFVGKKGMADDISSDFALRGILCQSIHGDREQCDREQALEDLRTGYVKILIATDIASRGLDIQDITHIFNYDFPRNIEEYVHRVGRTGRAGKSGKALTIISREDWKHAQELINVLNQSNQYIPDELVAMAERFDAWKQKKDQEREYERRQPRSLQDMAEWPGDRRGRGGGGGGRRNKW